MIIYCHVWCKLEWQGVNFFANCFTWWVSIWFMSWSCRGKLITKRLQHTPRNPLNVQTSAKVGQRCDGVLVGAETINGCLTFPIARYNSISVQKRLQSIPNHTTKPVILHNAHVDEILSDFTSKVWWSLSEEVRTVVIRDENGASNTQRHLCTPTTSYK